jgi:hypothetical protein
MAQWIFQNRPGYGVNANPHDSEHFVNDRVNRSQGLVREAIQNSLDAGGGGLVRIRFRLHKEAASSGATKKYLGTLRPHVAACELDLSDDEWNSPDFLVVEDFGTTGLTGDVEQESGNNYANFWRNPGDSFKHDKKRGRWGLGKTVFPNSSRISAFFGLTVRHDDGKEMLCGLAGLKKHDIPAHRSANDTGKYVAFGLFTSSGRSQLEMPIEDPSTLEQFRKTFRIARDSEPGFSVVVPFPYTGITHASLVEAVVENYFYAVIAKQLVVFVGDQEISEATIDSIAPNLGIPNIGRTISFARDVRASAAPQKVSNPDILNAPSGALSAKVFDEEELDRVRERYQNGELVSLRVDLPIKEKKSGATKMSYVDLYLRHEPEISRGRDYYLREGISVVEHRSFGNDDKAVGLLLAEHETICGFLGDSENPAHTAWNAKSRLINAKYHDAEKTVLFVRALLLSFYQTVAREEGSIDQDALKDFFSIEAENTDGKKKRKKKKPGDEPPPPPPPPPPPKPREIEIQERAGGFRVCAGPGLKAEMLPISVRITAAYDLRRGDAFKKYKKSDFRFGGNDRDIPVISIDLSGGAVTKQEANKFIVRVDDTNFECKCSGFDEKRDLRVRSTVLSEPE